MIPGNALFYVRAGLESKSTHECGGLRTYHYYHINRYILRTLSCVSSVCG